MTIRSPILGCIDLVFRALADPTRRSLLDELFEHDGQTLSALEQRLPMTRFGVMKHLRVQLEGHLGDRAGRRFMPPEGHARPAARGRKRGALRRLADDPLRPQDAARDRGVADDAWLAALCGRPGAGRLNLP